MTDDPSPNANVALASVASTNRGSEGSGLCHTIANSPCTLEGRGGGACEANGGYMGREWEVRER